MLYLIVDSKNNFEYDHTEVSAFTVTVAGGANLDSISQDVASASNSGTVVTVLTEGSSDADSDALKGIAVTGVDATHGSWEYSLNGGNVWNSLSGVSPSSARLLKSDELHRVRFVPNANFSGNAEIRYRSWDQTSGEDGGVADLTVAGGGAWVLVAYGAQASLGGSLTAASGSFSSSVRSGSAVLPGALEILKNSSELAMTWTVSGGSFPSSGIGSYTHGIAFALPNAAGMSFDGSASTPVIYYNGNSYNPLDSSFAVGSSSPDQSLVNVRTLVGSPGMPSQMYLRNKTFGAGYGGVYGLVMNDGSNAQLDYGQVPDGQTFKAVYLDHGTGAAQGQGLVMGGAGGAQNSFVPSTMALWARLDSLQVLALSGNSPVTASGNYLLGAIGTTYIDVIDFDASGAFSAETATGTIQVLDTSVPVITLIGANPLEIYKGATFSDLGATVTDNVDAARTITGSGTVNTATVGIYTLTYAATDAAGNLALPVTRTVNVVLNPAGDEDGDGATNQQEFAAGTNPYDSLSVPESFAYRFTFRGQAGRWSYQGAVFSNPGDQATVTGRIYGLMEGTSAAKRIVIETVTGDANLAMIYGGPNPVEIIPVHAARNSFTVINGQLAGVDFAYTYNSSGTFESDFSHTDYVPGNQALNLSLSAGSLSFGSMSAYGQIDVSSNVLPVFQKIAAETDFTFNSNTGSITGYSGLGGDVVIPSTIGGVAVTEIGNSAFNEKTTITAITLPNSVSKIGDGAFYHCDNLISITFGSGLKTIGDWALAWCGKLPTLIIPDSVTSLGEGAVSDCSALTNLTIGNQVPVIWRFTFSGDRNLTTVSLPASVGSIGEQAFSHCTKLATINFQQSVPPYVNGDAFYDIASGAKGYYPNLLEGLGWNRMGGTGSNSGNAISFNGSNQYVLAGNGTDHVLTTGTIECWIKSDVSVTDSDFHGIMVKQGAYGLFLVGNELIAYDWQNGGQRRTFRLLRDEHNNAWHHVAMSFQSGVTDGTVIYLDGQPVLTTTYTVGSSEEPLAIGAGFAGPVQLFQGMMDEVRVWNIVRTPAQIATYRNVPVSPSSFGLVSCFKFDESSGSSAGNAVAGGVTATLYNSPNWGSLSISGLAFPQYNSPPALQEIGEQSPLAFNTPRTIPLSASDAETPVAELIFTASSNNQSLFPAGNLEIQGVLSSAIGGSVGSTTFGGDISQIGMNLGGGSGMSWELVATPATGQSGEADITVTVTDGGGALASRTFHIIVLDAYTTWANQYFGQSGENTVPTADPDGDGATNQQEFAAGTNPNDASSYPPSDVPTPITPFLGLNKLYTQNSTNGPTVGVIQGTNTYTYEGIQYAEASALARIRNIDVMGPGSNSFAFAYLGRTNEVAPGLVGYSGYSNPPVFSTYEEATNRYVDGTYLFQGRDIGYNIVTNAPVVWSNSVTAFPNQAPEIQGQWAAGSLRLADPSGTNTISWGAWTNTSTNSFIRLEIKPYGGISYSPSAQTTWTTFLPADSTNCAVTGLTSNSYYQAQISFLGYQSGTIHSASTQFRIVTGPQNPPSNPQVLGASPLGVLYVASGGDVVGTLASVTDEDNGDVVSVELPSYIAGVSNDNWMFLLEGNQLKLRTSEYYPGFGANNQSSYSIVLRARDSFGLYTDTAYTVVVNKVAPTILTPPTSSTIVYGQTLSSSGLSGGEASVQGTFTWTSPSTAPAVGSGSQSVTFTPNDLANYEIVTTLVSVTVTDPDLPVATEDGFTAKLAAGMTTKVTIASLISNDKYSGILGETRGVTFVSASAMSQLGGTIQVKGGWLIYRPPSGIDDGNFDTFTYTVTNGTKTTTGTVQVFLVKPDYVAQVAIDRVSGDQVYFSVMPGMTFEVQGTSELGTSPTWTTIAGPNNGYWTSGADGRLVVTDPVAVGAASRFYKFRWIP